MRDRQHLHRALLASLLLLAWSATPPFIAPLKAAIAIVQKCSGHSPSGTTTCTLTGVGAGNAIIVTAYTFNDTTWQITDSAGSPVQDVANYQPISYVSAMWSVLNTSSGSHVITLTNGATNSLLIAWEISGLATSSAFDQSATVSPSCSTCAIGPTPSTTQANEIVIAFAHATSTGGWSSGDGDDFKAQADPDFSRDAGGAAKIVSATGAQTLTLTSGAVAVTEGLIGTYKMAGGGGGGGGTCIPRSLIGVGCDAARVR